MVGIAKKLCVGLLMGGLAIAPAVAQPPAAVDPQDTVTITGVIPERMRDYVQQLMEPGKTGQVSRWERTICPGVVGVKASAAQALVDHMAARALSVGLQVGEPGCKANILIIVTQDAQKFTPAFVDQNKKLFGATIDNGNSLGKQVLDTFTGTDSPVRWWHISQTVTDRGKVLGDSVATTAPGDGFNGVQVARVNSASRLSAGTHQEFNRIIMIVDSDKTHIVPFGAVADYVAMVALAQVKADVDAGGYDSVLNLFAETAAGFETPLAWTAWDMAFVEGLYAAPSNLASAKQQENEIVGHVREANREAEEAKSSQ